MKAGLLINIFIIFLLSFTLKEKNTTTTLPIINDSMVSDTAAVIIVIDKGDNYKVIVRKRNDMTNCDVIETIEEVVSCKKM